MDNKEKKVKAAEIEKKKRKINLSGPFAIVMALLVLIVFVPINLIVSYYDKFYDMTPNKKYTFHDETLKLLDETKDKNIEVYYLSELRYLKQIPRLLPLYHTLTQLEEHENVKLTCFRPDNDPALVAKLNPTGILNVKEGDVFVKYGDIIQQVSQDVIIRTVDGVDEYAGEELIAEAIKICTNGSLPTVYFLTGHGEKSIETSYKIYADQLRTKSYEVKELNLDEAGAIPGNTAIIYLAGPQKDLTDTEAELISQYLSQGGSASFLISPCETEGRFKNIDSILEEYGIVLDYNYVVETNHFNMLKDRDSVQNEKFLRVDYVPKTDDFTENLTSDAIYLVENEGYSPGISNARSMAEIPDDKFPNKGSFEISSMIRNRPDSSTGKYTTVSHAMGGDDDTIIESDKKLNGIQLDFGFYSYNKQTGGKLIAIGSTDMIDADAVAPDVNGTGTLTLHTNTWLFNTDIEMGIGVKIDAVDSMTFKDKNEATTAIAITVILPVCVAVLGVIVWLRRRHA